jgi:ATP-dependent helicase/DNAse subunit B
VTYSFLQKFTHCREQARLSFVEGLTQDGIVDALDWGTMFHELLQHQAEGNSVQERILRQRLERWLARETKFRKFTKDTRSHLQLLMDQVLTVFPYYYTYWKKKNGHEFHSDVVCQESDFRVPHRLSKPIEEQDRQILLRGRFDAVLRINGKLWLMENKTKSFIDEEGIQASLSQDMQTMLYCYAIKLQYGEAPVGVLYNIIRRPAHRFGKTDTPDSFLERVEQAIKDDPDKYFIRFVVQLGPDDIEAWVQRTLNPLLTQVCLWWDEIKPNPFNPWKIPNRVHHFQNPEGLYTKFGRSEFFDYLTRNGSMHGLRRRQVK